LEDVAAQAADEERVAGPEHRGHRGGQLERPAVVADQPAGQGHRGAPTGDEPAGDDQPPAVALQRPLGPGPLPGAALTGQEPAYHPRAEPAAELIVEVV